MFDRVRSNSTAIAIAVTASVLAATSPARAQDAFSATALVKVDRVTEEPFSATAPVIGRVVAREAGVVTARVGGPVTEVLVHEGDRVAKGDVVARLSTARLTAERDRKQALLARAEASRSSSLAKLRLAQNELRRAEQLQGSSAFQKGAYEDRLERVADWESQLMLAEAEIESAAAEMRLAEIDLDRAEIRAPYDGVVTKKHLSAGGYVSAGDPVVSMINDGDLEIEADVSVDQLSGLAPKVAVTFTLADGSVHTALVRAIVPDENPMTRTRAVRFTPDFGTISRPLAINQSATVQVPLGDASSVVSVHKDAVISRARGRIVFVVDAESSAQPRPVEIGRAVGSRFEVLGGLTVGEIVVVRGNERLQPGQKVRFEERL